MTHWLYDTAEDACKSSTLNQQMAAIIYADKEILSIGVNRHLTLSGKQLAVFGMPYCSIHAEVDAIKKMRMVDDLRGSSIYVHRIGGKLAKPCKYCLSLLYHMGITDIEWSE